MKKLSFIASLLISTLAFNATAETVFSWDFTQGLEGFTTYDEDGKKPNNDAINFGFSSEGSSWILADYEKNYCAASNSSYSPLSAANDWLVTPAITVATANTFSFDVASVGYKDGQVKVGQFSVYLSTTGNSVADFTTVLAEKVTAEKDWKNVGYDLSDYAGQTVYLAIVNTGKSKDALLVDNIIVGSESLAKIEVMYDRIQENTTQGQKIDVAMTVGYIEDITSLNATLTCGDFTSNFDVDEFRLSPGMEYWFEMGPLPAPTPGDPQVFEISVLLNKKENIVVDGEILTQAYQPAKRVVFEEQTGTWCKWCPRGHVAMEELEATYPDSYIGIASHINDIMANYNYSQYLSGELGDTGAPMGRVNRISTNIDPSAFMGYYNDYITRPAFADITLNAYWADETTINLTSTTTFALSANNFETRLEYIILEDDINVPGNDTYNQMNAYSGGSNGEMGGYEDMPSVVPAADMFYDDVVRRVITDVVGEGIKGSLPTAITKGEAYTHTVTTDVPASVLKLENCEFIVLLLDYATGEVLNAAKCTTINDDDAVEKVAAEDARVYAIGNAVRVELNTVAQVEVAVYAIDGSLVYAAAPRQVNGQVAIDCPVAAHGVYVVNVVCDGAAKAYKVIL